MRKILDLVENSSLKKSPVENFITKFARYYTPAVCIGALVLAIVPPLFLGGWLDWIMRALTFLVISCPCALVDFDPPHLLRRHRRRVQVRHPGQGRQLPRGPVQDRRCRV